MVSEKGGKQLALYPSFSRFLFTGKTLETDEAVASVTGLKNKRFPYTNPREMKGKKSQPAMQMIHLITYRVYRSFTAAHMGLCGVLLFTGCQDFQLPTTFDFRLISYPSKRQS